MSSLKEHIFRQYDIRGIYGKDLTDKDGELIGRAFGTMVLEGGETWVIVGRDNRKSSPALHRCLVHGLLSTGVNVLDIGVVISPIFYYAAHLYGVSSGLMITASHNPAQYNGFKVQFGGQTIYGETLQILRRKVNEGSFAAEF
jgi:phosphomannomutase/phosphoglucomutase